MFRVSRLSRILALVLPFVFMSLAPITSARAAEGESDLLQLYNYKPIYFLAGTSYTKIELSFKTQIVKSVPVYFGYTQLMMWDLFIHSPYFYDINYNPLVWYRLNLEGDANHWVDLIPYEHESNGKGGDLERTWNRVGAAYHDRFSLGDHTKLYLDFKAWIPFAGGSHNTDIAEYRGVWELDLTLSKFLSPYFDFDDVTFRLYPGGETYTNPLHGGQELTFRLRGGHREFLPLSVVQIFHGYGEYMQDYQVSQWGIRAGIGF
jgi:phospholipase A1